jgi:hypothetical protein
MCISNALVSDDIADLKIVDRCVETDDRLCEHSSHGTDTPETVVGVHPATPLKNVYSVRSSFEVSSEPQIAGVDVSIDNERRAAFKSGSRVIKLQRAV